MKVRELIEVLQGFSLDAKTDVIVHNRSEEYSIVWDGGSEGETKNSCQRVSFYVDRLCQNETATRIGGN